MLALLPHASKITSVTNAPAPDELIASLAAIPDAQERLAWIVERGRNLAPLPPQERVPGNRVPGCVSAVWLVDRSDDRTCRFQGDAEAPVLRGLVSLACARASGRTPAEVAADHTDLLATLRLERHLSPTRVEGLRSLQAHIRMLAQAHPPSASAP